MSYHLTRRVGFGQYRPGLGTSPSGGQIISSVGGVLESAGGALAATGVGVIPGAIVAAAGAIAQFMASMGIGSGCGQTCIQSTAFANQANAALQQNIEAYFALPTPRPKSAQTAAANNFMTMWNWLVSGQACGNPSLSSAGQRCISDRQQGACTWKQPAASVPPWGTPAAGECWNWWNGYYLPIVNDTNVYDDSATAQLTAALTGSSGSSYGSSVAPGGPAFADLSSYWPLALVAGLVALAVAV